MSAANATAAAQAVAKTTGHRAEFVLRVTELLQRIERTDRSRRALHRVLIINERKAKLAERAFEHDWQHLTDAAQELRDTIYEQGV